MPDSPFYQNARQNFSSSQSMQQPQGGFGGFGGGYQMPQQNWGGGFGGGYGSGFGFGGGFQPSFGGGFGGGYGGGFQPQQQFNPYQGGFGGGFQPQGFGGFGGFGGGFNPYQGGFGGGYNPMFGGIGGLGFNPMMGPQFGMPMQGFNPYQQQPQDFGSFDMMYRGGPQMSPEMQQRREQDMRNMERMAQQPGLGGLGGGPGQHDRINNPFTGPQRSAQDILSMAVGKTPQDMQYDLNKDGKITSADALAYQRQYGQQPQTPVDSGMNRGVDNMSIGPGFGSRQPMYGGLGSLGFNPMMGPQFGMPMGLNQQQMPTAQMTAERAAEINRTREQRENAEMQNTRSNWSQAAQGATSGMDFLQRLQGLSGGSYVPLSDEQMRLERDARLYSMTPQQRAMAQG